MAKNTIESVLSETRVFEPPSGFSDSARVKSMDEYRELYRQSMESPDTFWASVACTYSEILQRVGELTDLGMQLPVCQLANVAGFALPQNGCLVASRFQVPVETVVAHVCLSFEKPLSVRRMPLQHLCPLLEPMEIVGD